MVSPFLDCATYTALPSIIFSFPNCSLRALGYDLPMADEGEREPEFEAILDALDPNRDGFVTLQEYMAYMISKETDKVRPNIS